MHSVPKVCFDVKMLLSLLDVVEQGRAVDVLEIELIELGCECSKTAQNIEDVKLILQEFLSLDAGDLGRHYFSSVFK